MTCLYIDESYGIKSFPADNSKLAEMEFYLIDDLECDLTVFHPYRTLLTLCRKENTNSGSTDTEAEAGELAAEIEAETLSDKDKDGEIRYWGTGEGQLELQEGGLQMAWWAARVDRSYNATNKVAGSSSMIHIVPSSACFILHILLPSQPST
jgi:cyclin C